MMTDHAAKCVAFQSLHERRALFIIPNPWDAGSARILAAAGFKALATTSAGAAFSLGRRDGMMRRDEALSNAQAIVAACDLPVSADLENCYGHDPVTVAETIRLAFAAGLAGCSVEDASGLPAEPIYERAHAIERVQAAVEAKRGLPHPFIVTARAEGFLHGQGDLGEVLARLQAFEAAGADVVYAPGLPDLAAVRTVVRGVSCPVNVLIPGRHPFTAAELAEIGVVRISVGALLSRAALGAVMRAATEMAREGTFGWVNTAPPTPEINDFMAAPG